MLDELLARIKVAPRKGDTTASPAPREINVWSIDGPEAIPASHANREVGLCGPAITEVTDPVEGQEGDTKSVPIIDEAQEAREMLLSKVEAYLVTNYIPQCGT